jgi:hypothetical protein
MSPLTFTDALLQAERLARAALPPESHARLTCAVSLVKEGRVFQAANGDWQVDSTSTEGVTYTVNGTCRCSDVHYNHPPKGLCKHRLAMFLSQRLGSLLAQPAVPVVPDLVEPWPDNDPEPLPEVPAPALPAVPLPEAPASVNVRVQVGGREVQWTLRDQDEVRLATRLEALLQRYPMPQPTLQAASQDGKAWCHTHGVPMQHKEKHGRSWWSHKTQDGWCTGK